MTRLVVTLAPGADDASVRRTLIEHGLWVEPLRVDEPIAQLLVHSHSAAVRPEQLRGLEGIAEVSATASAHPRVDAQAAVVSIAGIAFGGNAAPVVLAGPCSIESETHIRDAAERVARAGGQFLRGGAFKPRTSPYSFQGHGARALDWLRRAADATGLRVVTEATAPDEVPAVAAASDLIQIGARNMANYALLAAVGRARVPALLKRGPAATIEEWLCAGEYCLVHGAPAVIFCERGVRGFDPETRNLVDIAGAALLAHVYRQPVIVDPSHGTGRRDLVPPLALAAIAAGAAGVMIETHDDPGRALSDGPQAISSAQLAALLVRIHQLAAPALRRASHA